jgi:hypothetical protein
MQSASVFAQDDSGVHPFISSKYSLQVGVFFPSKDFRIGVDGSLSGNDNEFDFNKSLNLDDSDNVFALEFKWRFGQKWSARFHYFATDRTDKAVLEEDIQWGDQTILAGSSVTAGANFDLTRVFFARSFDSRENIDFGIGLGVHWLEFGAFIKPDVMTNFGEVSSASVSGPLPNIGAWYYYSPSPKWFIGGRLDWLDASIDKYDGGIINAAAGVNYQLFKHFGIGLKYQLFRLKVDVDNDNWQGSAKFVYDGAFVYMSGNWK